MTQSFPRVPDWRARLAAEMARQSSLPFVWGQHDCLTGLVGGVVLALTDTDCTFTWRGRYGSARGALRVMRNDGFDNLGDLIGSLLIEHATPLDARVGDIAAVLSGDGFGFALGVVTGGMITGLTETGTIAASAAMMTRAFRVGD